MNLTEENKKIIDSLDYESLLSGWRNATIGDPWFMGDTGAYWSHRIKELRAQPGGNERHVAASKRIGW